MTQATDDLRIAEMMELTAPETLINENPVSEAVSATVSNARQTIHNSLTGDDDRLVIVVGPCSIHDPKAAREYAERLS